MSSRQTAARASCGVQISRDSGFLDPKNFDYIVVVGGLLHAGPQMDDETNAYLAAAARDGVTLVGLCTGGFILCRAGLMKGRRVCVSWYRYQDFLSEFPDHRVIADRMFFVDGNRITCSGGAGTADLASFLIERHLGRAIAQKARHVLLLDRVRAGSEAQPHPPAADEVVGDERVRRALLLMEQHVADPLPIAELASRLSISPRQLERLFQSVMGVRPGDSITGCCGCATRAGCWTIRICRSPKSRSIPALPTARTSPASSRPCMALRQRTRAPVRRGWRGMRDRTPHPCRRPMRIWRRCGYSSRRARADLGKALVASAQTPQPLARQDAPV